MNCPDYLRQHKLAWFYTPIWRSVHEENDMWSAVYCAKPRKGKSWLTLRHAWDLDRGENGKPRFPLDCSRVYFSAGDFAKGLAGKWPNGTVHILDDAGLNLFSREAMTKSVMDVAKIFQSVRFKNYIILMSLPSFNMLDKAVRTLIGAYIQPNRIDAKRKMVRAGVRFLNYDPIKGDLYRQKPVRSFVAEDTWLGYNVKNNIDVNEMWFDAPPKELTMAYEDKKDRCLGEYYDKTAASIVARENKSSGNIRSKYDVEFLRVYDEVLANPGLYGYKHPKKGFFVVEMSKIYTSFPNLPSSLVPRVVGQVNNRLKLGVKLS